MRTMLVCAAVAALATSAAAEIRYDRKLEAAVMQRVAARIGDIRGGFDPAAPVVFFRAADPIVTGSVSQEEWPSLRGAIVPPAGQGVPLRKVSRVVF